MTNKLEIVQPIDKRSLDQAHYFASLVDRAASLGLLENAGDIKRQTLMLTAKLAQRFTFGASSSVKEETAQALLESVFYCAGRRLKAMETGDALKALKQNSVEGIWNEGRKLIKRDVEKARALYESLKENALETENIAYNETLGEGIASFFKSYDIDFAAHEIPGMIDYFLCIELPELSGAEYMLAYLERLGMENGFCAYYGRDVETLLRSHSGYWRELNVNIFELVLANAIGRVLCGNDARSLDISGAGREKLKRALAAMSRQRLKAVICAASQRVCTEAGASDALKSYALAAAGQISARVYLALRTDTLGEVFVEYKAPVKKSRFVDAPPMEDDAFRALTDEIRGCRRMSDKLGLVKNIRSIKDLEDMLGASCLYVGEFEALFGTLGDGVLALLYLHVPEDGALHVTEDEKEWQAALIAYLEKTGKAARIREAAEGLERE